MLNLLSNTKPTAPIAAGAGTSQREEHSDPSSISDTGAGDAPAGNEQLARRQAITEIERRRRFSTRATWSGLVMIVVVIVWSLSEYHNAGGWPTNGFSNSSSIPHVWNYWIIYPVLIWLAVLAVNAWNIYRHKPISEQEIERQIRRQTQAPR
jgi:hypothetical protein